MWIALMVVAAALVDWVPARWISTEPASLELLDSSPVNCLLVDADPWPAAFAAAASKRKFATLAVVRPGVTAEQQATNALVRGASGLVLEGVFDTPLKARLRQLAGARQLPVIEIAVRSDLRLDSSDPILATDQGVWPGIRLEEGGKIHAAPSGGPWIDTNSGFLRYVKASAPDAVVWMANAPAAGTIETPERTIQAAADAYLAGARWVLSFDKDFAAHLLKRDEKALADWHKIGRYLTFFEQNRQWRDWKPSGELAIVEDPPNGALLSGNIVDMVVVKHTPVRAVPPSAIESSALAGTKMAVVVDPQSLTPEQTAALRAYRRAGGTTLSGPPGWKFPEPGPGQMTLAEADVKKIEQIWKEINSLIYHENLGARLFNVSTVLSQLLESPDGKRRCLLMVNYSDYPLEAVTAYIHGKYTKARLIAPDAPPRDLEVYGVEEGTGVDIERVGLVAALIVE